MCFFITHQVPERREDGAEPSNPSEFGVDHGEVMILGDLGPPRAHPRPLPIPPKSSEKLKFNKKILKSGQTNLQIGLKRVEMSHIDFR